MDDAPRDENDNLGGETQDLLESLRRHQRSTAALAALEQELPQAAALRRVERSGRLVEEENVRIAEQADAG